LLCVISSLHRLYLMHVFDLLCYTPRLCSITLHTNPPNIITLSVPWLGNFRTLLRQKWPLLRAFSQSSICFTENDHSERTSHERILFHIIKTFSMLPMIAIKVSFLNCRHNEGVSHIMLFRTVRQYAPYPHQISPIESSLKW
jgi:hypothetical protein